MSADETGIFFFLSVGETLFLGGGILLLEHRKRGVRKKRRLLPKHVFLEGGARGA